MRKFYSDEKLECVCKSNGHSYIKRVEDKTESIVEMSCGHVQTLKESSIVKNSYKCLVCRENEIIKKAALTDLMYVSTCENNLLYSYYKYSCGHTHRVRNDVALKDVKHQCKECRVPRKVYQKKYREENKDAITLVNQQWNLTNAEHVRARRAEFYFKNRESLREKGREHYQNNKATYLYYSKLRKLTQKQRTPRWLNREQKKQILEFYKESRRLQDETGVTYHVDHIIPLCGKTVCGLHVPWNLQVLEGKENLKKSNQLMDKYLEMPERLKELNE